MDRRALAASRLYGAALGWFGVSATTGRLVRSELRER